jgi:hypothetical protein
MSIAPFRLARSPGSQFEVQQPIGSVYLSYGPESMGILLVTRPYSAAASSGIDVNAKEPFRLNMFTNNRNNKQLLEVPPLRVGSLIDSISIVYDDVSPNGSKSLPRLLMDANKSGEKNIVRIRSPGTVTR